MTGLVVSVFSRDQLCFRSTFFSFNSRPHVKELPHPEKQRGIQTSSCSLIHVFRKMQGEFFTAGKLIRINMVYLFSLSQETMIKERNFFVKAGPSRRRNSAVWVPGS